MTMTINLVFEGELFEGGTTAEAQCDFLWANSDVLRGFGAQWPKDKASQLRDKALAILKRDHDMDPRRETGKLVRQLIYAGQIDEKARRQKHGSIRTAGPKRNSSPRATDRSSTPAEATAAAAASHGQSDRQAPTVAPAAAPTESISNNHVGSPQEIVSPPPKMMAQKSAAPLTPLSPIEVAGPARPRITSMIRDLQVVPQLKSLLFAARNSEPLEKLVELRRLLPSDWCTHDLPDDVVAMVSWIDAQG